MNWFEIYREICTDLHINCEDDAEASRLLSSFHPRSESLLHRLSHYVNRHFTVIGPYGGRFYARDNSIIVVADSAIERVQVAPHLIVTDLDGNLSKILHYFYSGSTLCVHAHGDNLNQMTSFMPFVGSSFIGTSQVPGEKSLINPEGFTDGDRAVIMADRLGAKTIRLDGFNFSEPVEKRNSRDKGTKLKYAEIIIRDVVWRRTGKKFLTIPEVF
jgi:Uncharacterized Rossmann fold enzyme